MRRHGASRESRLLRMGEEGEPLLRERDPTDSYTEGEGEGAASPVARTAEGEGEGAAGTQVPTGPQAADEQQSDFEKQMKSALNANTKGCCGGKIKSPTMLIESVLSEYARKETENNEVLPTSAAQFSQEDKDKMRLSRKTKRRLIDAATQEVNDAAKKDKPAKSLERAMISVWIEQPELHPFTSHGFSISEFKDNKSLKCVAAMQLLTTIQLKKKSELEVSDVDMNLIALHSLETLSELSWEIGVYSSNICPEVRKNFAENIKMVTDNLLKELHRCKYHKAIINSLVPEVKFGEVYKTTVQIYLHIKSMCNTHRVEPYFSVAADTDLFRAKRTADKSREQQAAEVEKESVLSYIDGITSYVHKFLSKEETIGGLHIRFGTFMDSKMYQNSRRLRPQHKRFIDETAKLMRLLITLETNPATILDSAVTEIQAMKKTSLQELVQKRITAAAGQSLRGAGAGAGARGGVSLFSTRDTRVSAGGKVDNPDSTSGDEDLDAAENATREDGEGVMAWISSLLGYGNS